MLVARRPLALLHAEAVGAYMEQTFLAAAQGVAGRRRARKRADRGPFVVLTDEEAE